MQLLKSLGKLFRTDANWRLTGRNRDQTGWNTNQSGWKINHSGANWHFPAKAVMITVYKWLGMQTQASAGANEWCCDLESLIL